MRLRVALAAIGALAGLTLSPAAAHAASPAAHTTAVPAQWYPHSVYPDRWACNSAAEQLKQQGVYPQCRGPYAEGAFQLWYYG
ncbi:hypothetical protein ACLF6K_38160 (plasmid) [Streptomyces xanthophaeus]|uniref:hypothetical protein n=1 Tax=Streptomyces xanthophaeus TaxID=67385 RepID=UPI0039900AD5